MKYSQNALYLSKAVVLTTYVFKTINVQSHYQRYTDPCLYRIWMFNVRNIIQWSWIYEYLGCLDSLGESHHGISCKQVNNVSAWIMKLLFSFTKSSRTVCISPNTNPLTLSEHRTPGYILVNMFSIKVESGAKSSSRLNDAARTSMRVWSEGTRRGSTLTE